MKTKKHTLEASTILEVIVASVLFLILFSLAMEMLVRIAGRQPDNALLQAEIDRKACVHEFKTGVFEQGEYVREYDWGTITITVSPYRTLQDIDELHFLIHISKGNRTLFFRTLTTRTDEKTNPHTGLNIE